METVCSARRLKSVIVCPPVMNLKEEVPGIIKSSVDLITPIQPLVPTIKLEPEFKDIINARSLNSVTVVPSVMNLKEEIPGIVESAEAVITPTFSLVPTVKSEPSFETTHTSTRLISVIVGPVKNLKEEIPGVVVSGEELITPTYSLVSNIKSEPTFEIIHGGLTESACDNFNISTDDFSNANEIRTKKDSIETSASKSVSMKCANAAEMNEQSPDFFDKEGVNAKAQKKSEMHGQLTDDFANERSTLIFQKLGRETFSDEASSSFSSHSKSLCATEINIQISKSPTDETSSVESELVYRTEETNLRYDPCMKLIDVPATSVSACSETIVGNCDAPLLPSTSEAIISNCDMPLVPSATIINSLNLGEPELPLRQEIGNRPASPKRGNSWSSDLARKKCLKEQLNCEVKKPSVLKLRAESNGKERKVELCEELVRRSSGQPKLVFESRNMSSNILSSHDSNFDETRFIAYSAEKSCMPDGGQPEKMINRLKPTVEDKLKEPQSTNNYVEINLTADEADETGENTEAPDRITITSSPSSGDHEDSDLALQDTDLASQATDLASQDTDLAPQDANLASRDTDLASSLDNPKYRNYRKQLRKTDTEAAKILTESESRLLSENTTDIMRTNVQNLSSVGQKHQDKAKLQTPAMSTRNLSKSSVKNLLIETSSACGMNHEETFRMTGKYPESTDTPIEQCKQFPEQFDHGTWSGHTMKNYKQSIFANKEWILKTVKMSRSLPDGKPVSYEEKLFFVEGEGWVCERCEQIFRDSCQLQDHKCGCKVNVIACKHCPWVFPPSTTLRKIISHESFCQNPVFKSPGPQVFPSLCHCHTHYTNHNKSGYTCTNYTPTKHLRNQIGLRKHMISCKRPKVTNNSCRQGSAVCAKATDVSAVRQGRPSGVNHEEISLVNRLKVTCDPRGQGSAVCANVTDTSAVCQGRPSVINRGETALIKRLKTCNSRGQEAAVCANTTYVSAVRQARPFGINREETSLINRLKTCDSRGQVSAVCAKGTNVSAVCKSRPSGVNREETSLINRLKVTCDSRGQGSAVRATSTDASAVRQDRPSGINRKKTSLMTGKYPKPAVVSIEQWKQDPKQFVYAKWKGNIMKHYKEGVLANNEWITKTVKMSRSLPDGKLISYEEKLYFLEGKGWFCERCEDVFQESCQLQDHKSGCNIDGIACVRCPRVFDTLQQSRSHQMYCQRPVYKCPECPRIFATLHCYYEHYSNYHERGYICVDCTPQTSFRGKINFKKHMNMCHIAAKIFAPQKLKSSVQPKVTCGLCSQGPAICAKASDASSLCQGHPQPILLSIDDWKKNPESGVFSSKSDFKGGYSKWWRKGTIFADRKVTIKTIKASRAPQNGKPSSYEENLFYIQRKGWVCERCEQVFPKSSQVQLQDHKKGCSAEGIACEHCPRVFNTLRESISHQSYCQKPVYKCPECLRIFPRLRQYHIHYSNYHETTAYTCIDCSPPKSFENKIDLRYHMRNYLEHYMNTKNIDSSTVACNACGFVMQRHRLKRHMEMHNKKKLVSCSACGLVLQGKQLKRHMQLHDKKKFVCMHCGLRLMGQRSLSKHYKTHDDTGNPAALMCTFCGKFFELKTELVKHLKEHASERSFICEYCGKGFFKKPHLDTHVLSHKEKKFICPNCDRGFVLKHQLAAHLRTIACGGDNALNSLKTKRRVMKPEYKKSISKIHFTCANCDKNFVSKRQKIIHLRTTLCGRNSSTSKDLKKVKKKEKVVSMNKKRRQLPKAQYTCATCDQCFIRKSQLIAHFKNAQCGDGTLTSSIKTRTGENENSLNRKIAKTEIKDHSKETPMKEKHFITAFESFIQKRQLANQVNSLSCRNSTKVSAEKAINCIQVSTQESHLVNQVCNGNPLASSEQTENRFTTYTGRGEGWGPALLDKQLICGSCEKCFGSKQLLNDHICTAASCSYDYSALEVEKAAESEKAIKIQSIASHKRRSVRTKNSALKQQLSKSLRSTAGSALKKPKNVVEAKKGEKKKLSKKQFVCKDCGKCFTSKRQLTSHVCTHAVESFKKSKRGKLLKKFTGERNKKLRSS